LWAISGVQFMQNIGWLFVAMQLPTYLSSVHKVPLDLRGVMTSFPMGVSIIGIFAGGRFTDWAMHRFGLKLGRRIPLLLAGGFAASGYGFCLLFSSIAPQSDRTWLPWLFVAAFCVAAFSNDFGIPATWSFAQDVGGKFTASILGWGNMWGNLGAACAPLIYNYCLGENPTLSNWNTMFAVCGGAFLIAGCCASIVDASKPIKFEDVSKSDAN
jgi:ACS family glucarate transporter-like MFS transporter